MASASSIFSEDSIPQQRCYGPITFPTVLTLSTQAPPDFDFATSIRDHKAWLQSRLHHSGALLFRGFPLRTPSDFNAFVEAFGLEEQPYAGPALRNKVVGRVFTANESPPDRKIRFHHEMALMPEFPSKLFFFCEVEPESGGETPIVLSHIIYEQMKHRYPDFVQRLEEHGLLYTRVMGEDDDPSSPIGKGWKSTFSTSEKDVAEQRAANMGVKLEWTEDGGARRILGPVPAIKYDGTRQRKIWFNSMVAEYAGWKNARNDPVKTVTFENGKPLPADIVFSCMNLHEEESVVFPWQQGDVLWIDNWAVLHARRPCNSPRRILASLCK
ncbi:unnamed protein product [Rhodiola kirilowii]